MKKRLFLICPFGNTEHFIRENITGIHYFYTAPGGTFNWDDVPTVEEIASIIGRERITEIVIALSSECRFVSNLLSKSPKHGLPVEHKLEDLLVSNLEQLKKIRNKKEKSIFISQKLAAQELEHIKSNTMFNYIIKTQGISLKAIVIDQKRPVLIHSHNNSEKLKYEL